MLGPLPDINAPSQLRPAQAPRADIQTLLAEAAKELRVDPKVALKEALSPDLITPVPRSGFAIHELKRDGSHGLAQGTFIDRSSDKVQSGPETAMQQSDDQSTRGAN